VAALAVPTTAQAQTVTLTWDANTEPDVAGYRLYYGESSGNYTNQVDVGNRTTYQITGLDPAKQYFFAVRAYSAAGLSGFSNEVEQAAKFGQTQISRLTSSAAYPLLVGQPVTWTAAATSTWGAVEYRFVRRSAGGQWIVAQDYGSAASYTWTPGWGDLGKNVVQVWARSAGSTATYEAWVGTDPFDVNALPVELKASREFPTPPGQPVTWTASVVGSAGAGLEYRFISLNHATGVWSVIREYGTSNQATWTPSAVGDFTVQVWIRRVGATTTYDMWAPSGTVTIARSTLQVTRLDVNQALPAATGTPITWTAHVKGGEAGPTQYQFVRYSAKSGWQVVRPYSTSNTFTWTPTWGDDGTYAMQVWARNAGSSATYDAWLGGDYFQVAPASIHLTTTARFPVPPGTTVNWTASVSDSSVNVEYQYVLYDRATGSWSVARTYSTNPSFAWRPSVAGTYLFQIWARRVGSTAAYEVWRSTEYLQVGRTPAQVQSLTPSTTLPGRVGQAITWTALASGGTAAPLQYRFVVYTEGRGWSVLREWGTGNSVTWTPSADHLGDNVVQVWVRSAGSTATYEGWLGTAVFSIQP
jgi:hypothetical protein